MEFEELLVKLATEPEADIDLAWAALLLARDEYPELDIEAYLCELDGMAREASHFMRGSLESRVYGLCRYLFHEMGFRGNVKHYYDPHNSYLNEVLDRRRGIPITLTILAMAVGRRGGLTVEGVGLPGHFIAKAADNGQVVFFDPFHGGRQLELADCELLVEKATGTSFEATPDNLVAISPARIVARLLGNLKLIYSRQDDHLRAIRTSYHLVKLLPSDPVERRDLGVSLLRAGYAGKALPYLSFYVNARPEAEDAEDISQLASRATAEISRWN